MKARLVLFLLLLSFSAFGQEFKEREWAWTFYPGSPNSVSFQAQGYQRVVFEPQDTATYIYTLAKSKKVWPSVQRFMAADHGSTSAGVCSATINGTVYIGCLDLNDFIQYSWTFSTAKTKAKIYYSKAPTTSGRVEIRSGSVTGPIVASFITPSTGGWTAFSTIETTIAAPGGSNTYYMTFKSGLSEGNANVMWIEFE